MLLNPKNLSLTLFVSILITLAVTSVEANDFAHRRAHDSLKRLVKKRSPFPDVASALVPVENAVPDPNTSASSPVSAASASTSAQISTSASASVSVASASVSASTSSASLSISVSASASASSASVALVSVSSAVPTTTTPTTTAAQTTAAAQETVTAAAAADSDQVKSTVTHTASVVAAAAATNSVSPASAAATQTKSTVTTVIIVVAASVGGLAILWTIFRKWKLGQSSKFNERMAPIDWQPTNDEGIVPAHRRTNSRASSFQSSTNHDSGPGSYHGHAPSANLAPVGGYADLARGSSPQPQMQEALARGPSVRSYNDGLARGPSTTRSAYDNGVPLHHQAGYGQAEAYDYNGDAVRF